MTKRSVALVGVLVVMAMIGSSVIGAVSAWATSDAANGTYSVFLPLIMNAIGAMAEVPQGAVMTFNLSSCPSGWTEVTDAQGRAIVGLPAGGTLSGTVGSGLGDLEDRSHTHDVNPASTSTTTSGNHSHLINPPIADTSNAGEHYHSLTGFTYTEETEHNHQWVTYNQKNWTSWNLLGSEISIFTWGDGVGSEGAGQYPLNRNNDDAKAYFTDTDAHRHRIDFDWTGSYARTTSGAGHEHTIDISEFSSGQNGDHQHSVDIPNTSSTTASTSDVMAYIQFLVCEKD